MLPSVFQRYFIGINFFKFLYIYSFFIVLQNATIGSEIIQVRALDDDVGPNAAVLYRLKPDSLGNYRSFAIDQVSGVLTLKQRLDRERQKILDVRNLHQNLSELEKIKTKTKMFTYRYEWKHTTREFHR